MSKISIFCDGGARGNPGPAASAFVAIQEDQTIQEEAVYLGEATNNTAEYKSLTLALKWISKNTKEEDEVLITLDSQLVYKQVLGEYKVKDRNLQMLMIEVRDLEKRTEATLSYRWSPRSGNKRADELVNEKLDEKTR